MIKNYNTIDQRYLEQAIDLARNNVAGGGGPFGAVIVKDGKIIATGVNRVTDRHDATAHAEILAIREANRKLGTHELKDCTLYSSCEPCPMCLGAVYWAGISRLVFASTNIDAKNAGFSDAEIYEELKLPIEKRKLQTEQLNIESAGAEFNEWKELEEKEEY